MDMNLAGQWKAVFPDGKEYMVGLPGTLDTNGLGDADKKNLDNRFTRVHIYEGAVSFTRKIKVSDLNGNGKRVFFEVERARCLWLKIDGQEVPAYVYGTLSTPYIFEITQYLNAEEIELEVISDNSYPNLPLQGILTSSAATNETQTNWNGLLGYIRLRMEEPVFIEAVRVYPHGETVDVEVDLSAEGSFVGNISLSCEAFTREETLPMNVPEGGRVTSVLKGSKLHENIRKWDEAVGNLYVLSAVPQGYKKKDISFGIRDFGVNKNYRLTINNRVFFLRGEANCAVFPEEGHPPMTVKGWEKILSVYASYGVNCMRFHSWCPPKAAFTAADRMGMMMQPELSHWDWSNAFESDESYKYYTEELKQILRYLANHPSFVMLSFGNELWCEELGHKRMDELLDLAHAKDKTRLYANSSNPHYGQRGTDSKSDFYTSHDYKELHLRGASTENAGHINEQYPTAKTNYNPAVQKVHESGQPVFSFEVGQSEVFPDFKEIDMFKGVTRAINYQMIKEKVEKSGRLENWEEWVNATGEISLMCYREEIEAALRTEGMSGLSLLGLQDFPGQGTATVGMINSHMESKPYPFAAPARFRRFFAPVVPLLYLDKYTYDNTERLQAEIRLANYGKSAISDVASWKLCKGEQILAQGSFNQALYHNECLRTVGMIEQDLNMIKKAERLDIHIAVGSCENSYPIWVYPKSEPIGFVEQEEAYYYQGKDGVKIRIASYMDEESLKWLEAGGSLYLEPRPLKEKMPASIGGQFTTDFWSVGTFPNQEGGMGMVIDQEHPVLRDFPTEGQTNWQWWLMASGRPMILPENIKPILTVPDSYRRLKHMGLLFEAKAGAGVVMVSGMGLRYNQKYPEAVALLHSILAYMQTDGFEPKQYISIPEIEKLVCA